ncbi:type VI secretion system ATPase TssH [Devosia sp. Root635]|uniref:type VI secretion system ATPase TssH n=1 Tax=Devosia sp. Root635 TaxID=1736575 RepID=UPI0006FEF234|nr:type VI secretion system ATPase TssH [Devosia sp. Root635]KRA53082.1 ClpV1 family T6SS ATPase [Devosia sp. Root635]
MSDISLETVTGKLNRLGYDTFMQSLRHAKNAGNRNLELAHWMFQIVSNDRSDVTLTLAHYGIDRSKVLAEIGAALDGFRKNETEMPGIADPINDALDRGWYYATLMFGEAQIRTGHILLAALKDLKLRPSLQQASRSLMQISADTLAGEANTVWAQSDEENLRPMDGSGLAAPAAGASGDAPRGNTALSRYSIDMTATAESGKMDPIVGRDDEIRQLIDVLMRRRQNNPILTGEAGVGKTAVVEGFAQRLASGDVPPQLKGVRLHALDIGLMQAGASMKGEFEQRLRSLIDEVQASPTPLILFIDEAHTLIGAGGNAGTGDAANLLKPALARGTLRTIGATTWSEYRQYFEKDPALTRRFQPVAVEEPSVEKAAYMLRGILKPMEAHHRVRISDAAVVAAVTLSARYIPARQLPDKAVSLLDTACARVAISQSTTPAAIADLKDAIQSRKEELTAIDRQSDIGGGNPRRTAELDGEIADIEVRLAELTELHQRESALVDQISALRAKLLEETDETVPAEGPSTREQIAALVAELNGFEADTRMVYPYVDEQAVAAVVSDWTGIPVGKMVSDEMASILKLAETLKKRVVGQDHGLEMIAKRIETNRAKLDNPNKPIGVFMLCGPSGVGKTETALALAEALYGGEQSIITINMSEFQEAHTVSLLKGAPPGYVGYGEGGRLTEAVRRKPYSVVLLDEVEKAHPDVHELFFQVFDKGQMEDGNGRVIDFKNCLIILTSNVGTDIIMHMAERGQTRPTPAELEEALKPSLVQVFPPALLGRIVTIPYFPLSPDMLAGIVRIQLNRIKRRVAENHEAEFVYSDAVVDYIASRCNDPDSGGRMIDNILTNSLLPELSRHYLNRMIGKQPISRESVDVVDGVLVYDIV